MKATAIDVRQHFQAVLGTRPWKASLGVGSFLTFEFGRRVKEHGRAHGAWHLWIYQSNWTLLHGSRKLADSDADRRMIRAAIRRLEQVDLTDVELGPNDLKTTFVFDDFRLVVSPADYLSDAEKRDHSWLFFMPTNEVLTVGPHGINVERSGSNND